MPALIQAFHRYGPRLVRRPAIQLDDLVARLSQTAGLRHSLIQAVLRELADAVLHHARRGASLHLPGLGTFRPSIRGDGELRLHFRIAPSLQQSFADRSAFRGTIVNRARIGLSPAGYKALWDADHPDRPLDLSQLPLGSPSTPRPAPGARSLRSDQERSSPRPSS